MRAAGAQGEGGGSCGCGRTGAEGFNRLVPVLRGRCWDVKCAAAQAATPSSHCAPGERLPVAAVLRETVRAAVGVRAHVCVCVYVCAPMGRHVQNKALTLLQMEFPATHTHASEQSHLALYTFSAPYTAVPILSADPSSCVQQEAALLFDLSCCCGRAGAARLLCGGTATASRRVFSSSFEPFLSLV